MIVDFDGDKIVKAVSKAMAETEEGREEVEGYCQKGF